MRFCNRGRSHRVFAVAVIVSVTFSARASADDFCDLLKTYVNDASNRFADLRGPQTDDNMYSLNQPPPSANPDDCWVASDNPMVECSWRIPDKDQRFAQADGFFQAAAACLGGWSRQSKPSPHYLNDTVYPFGDAATKKRGPVWVQIHTTEKQSTIDMTILLDAD